MKAPKCRLCGKLHWGVCEGAKGSVINELREKIVHTTPLVVHKEEVVVHEVVHTKHGKYADLEKRKAYRREWMRRKRAKGD